MNEVTSKFEVEDDFRKVRSFYRETKVDLPSFCKQSSGDSMLPSFVTQAPSVSVPKLLD
jgi:hypothetical protein